MRIIMKNSLIVISILIFSTIIGCSKDNIADPYFEISEMKLLNMAKGRLVSGQYADAVAMFESFEAQYPTSKFAESALVEHIYAQYSAEDYDLALATIERFVKLYPASEYSDYVLYLRGILLTAKDRTFFDTFFKEDLSERDITFVHESYNSFKQLVAQHPNSKYVGDAKHRMVFLRNLLAQAELNIAKYYFDRGLFVAALNRAVYVVETYQQAPQAIQALAIALQSNRILGFTESYRDAVKIIGLNFPEAKILKNL